MRTGQSINYGLQLQFWLRPECSNVRKALFFFFGGGEFPRNLFITVTDYTYSLNSGEVAITVQKWTLFSVTPVCS